MQTYNANMTHAECKQFIKQARADGFVIDVKLNKSYGELHAAIRDQYHAPMMAAAAAAAVAEEVETPAAEEYDLLNLLADLDDSTDVAPVVIQHLDIEKRPSLLETDMLEYIPLDRLECMEEYINKFAQNEFDKSNRAENAASLYYSNIREQFKAYKSNYNNGAVGVRYIKPRHGWGRVSPYRARGLTSFAKDMRNALIIDNYYDFDLKNCQPEIIHNLCVSNGIPCDAISKYCDNRDAIFAELALLYSCPEKKIKKLFLRLCFFGSFNGWKQEENITGNASIFINEFTQNLQNIAAVIREKNPKLYECARQGQNRQNKTNYLGSMFALYVQEYELRIIEAIVEDI